MGKSRRSDSARARSQKQQKEAWRHATPDARERIPTNAGDETVGFIISPMHTNGGLLASSFLERFLDRSGAMQAKGQLYTAGRAKLFPSSLLT